MKFKQFIDICYSIFSAGATKKQFILIMFDNITNEKYNGNTAYDYEGNTLMVYYYGKRGMSAFARKILPEIDVTKFATYIEELSDDQQLLLYRQLIEYYPNIKKATLSEDVADIFRDIIAQEAVGKENLHRKQNDLIEDVFILTEYENKCPQCGSVLINKRNEKILSKYKIVDLDNGDNITLCLECAKKYDISNLYLLKQEMQKKRSINNFSETVDLEENIRDIITRISELRECPKIHLSKRAVKVANKIPSEYYLLRHEIESHVLDFFKYIQSVIVELESNNRLKYNIIATEFRLYYQKISSIDGINHLDIYDEMIKWIMNKTGIKDKKACAVVVSYFVQDCEVYDVIT